MLWNEEWFFSRHVSWTLGSIWWQSMKYHWMDQKSFRASSSSSNSSSRNSSPSTWDSPPEVLSLYGVFPSHSGFLDFVVSSWKFCLTICHKKYKNSVFVGYQDFFCIQSSGIYFWCIQLFNSSISAIRISSSHIHTAKTACPRKIPKSSFIFEFSRLPWDLGHFADRNGIS